METPTPIQVEPQKSNTGLIIGIVVVVLLCCCCLVVIGALTIMGPIVGKTFSSINNNLLTPMPAKPFLLATPDLSGVPTLSSDQVPQGGKSDQFSRVLAWSKVLIAASTDGCSYNLKPSDTQIKVTQEADSKGVWKEQWTVVCDNGTKKPYDVTFTPDANGVTDIVVTAGQ